MKQGELIARLADDRWPGDPGPIATPAFSLLEATIAELDCMGGVFRHPDQVTQLRAMSPRRAWAIVRALERRHGWR